jgi:hypothetical protein
MTPPVAALDKAALERLRRIGGQEFLVEMIDLFLDHGPQRLDGIRDGMDVGDATQVDRWCRAWPRRSKHWRRMVIWIRPFPWWNAWS